MAKSSIQRQIYNRHSTFKFQVRAGAILISQREGIPLIHISILVSTLIFAQIPAPSRFYLVLLNPILISDPRYSSYVSSYNKRKNRHQHYLDLLTSKTHT